MRSDRVMAGTRSAIVSTDADRRRWAWAIGICAAILAAMVVFKVIADSDTTVSPPSEEERRDTVQVLQRNADQQGICYGWLLKSGSTVVSVGSNLGDGVPVDDSPTRCPRWQMVEVNVTYTSAGSELSDWASVRVRGEPLELNYVDGLDRFGLSDSVFLDDPGWATCRAAVLLPLLAVEAGLAEPVPVPPAESAEPPAALPDAGSDLLRSRFVVLLGAFLLIAAGVVLVAIGWVQRRRIPVATFRPARAGRSSGRASSGRQR